MINRAEAEICKGRGHDAGLLAQEKWSQCKYCHKWIRKIQIIEEREDEPPADERNPFEKYNG